MIVSLRYLLFSKKETEEKKYKRRGDVEVAWRKGRGETVVGMNCMREESI